MNDFPVMCLMSLSLCSHWFCISKYIFVDAQILESVLCKYHGHYSAGNPNPQPLVEYVVKAPSPKIHTCPAKAVIRPGQAEV